MCGLERVDQVELQAVQVRLLLSGFGNGRKAVVVVEQSSVVFQIRVENAPTPPGKAGEGVGTQLPQSVEAVLQNVGGSSLIAFNERRDGGVLFFAEPRVANLNIILVLHLAHAGVKPIFLVLAAQSLDDGTLGVQRMIFRIEVIEELKQHVDRQTGKAGLDLVGENEIGVVVAGVEVGHPFGIDGGGVGHAIGRKDAGRVGGQASALGAALAFAGDWDASDRSWSCSACRRGGLETGGGGSGCKRAFLQDRIRTVPLQAQEGGRNRPGSEYEPPSYLHASSVGILGR